MRIHRIVALLALIAWLPLVAGCLTTKARGTEADATADEDEFRSSSKKGGGDDGLSIERKTTKFSDKRPTPKPSKAELRDFPAVWELFRKNDRRWPVERDRFKRRSEGAGYLLAGYLLHYYMQVNAVRQRAPKQLVRVKNEIVAVGEPCVTPLIDMMILDRIPMKQKGKYFIVDDLTRQDCVDMLERMEAVAVPQLLAVLERKDVGIKGRHMTALALGGTKQPSVYGPLVKLLQKDKAWQVRFSAATALGKLGDRRAVRPLYQASRSDPDKSVRKRAAKIRKDILIGKPVR